MQQFIRGFLEKISQYNVLVDVYLKASSSAPDAASAFLNWGVQLAEAGQLEASLEKFKKATQMAPGRPECYTNWGIALAKLGRLDEATKQFQAAIERDADAPSNYLMWGAVLMAQGQFELAHQRYQQALALRPNQPDLHTHWGISLTLCGRFQEAVEQFRLSLSLNPSQPQVCFLWGATLAEIATQTGDYDSAIERFRDALRLDARFFDALYCWSVALNRQGRYKEAIEKAKQALNINPERPEVYLALGDALAGQGRLDIAIANYRQAIQMVPHQPDAYVGLASALYRLHQPENALPVILRAMELTRAAASNPSQGLSDHASAVLISELYTLWVNILNGLGQFEEALNAAIEGLTFSPAHIGLQLQKVVLLLKLGRQQEAVSVLMALEPLAKTDAGLQYVIGTHYLGANELSKAKVAFETVLALSPAHEEAAISLSLVLSDIGQAQEAVRILRPFYRKYAELPLEPAKTELSAADTALSLALMKASCGYESSQKQESKQARIVFYYGMALFSAGDIDEAIQKFQYALTILPSYQEALVALGEAFLAQGKIPEAIHQLQETVAQYPKADLAWMLLSLCYLQQSDWDKALNAVEHQLDLEPAAPAAVEAWSRKAYILAKKSTTLPSKPDKYPEIISRTFDEALHQLPTHAHAALESAKSHVLASLY
ncbi:MAG: tetratricopeptide repeat protein [Vampirovibrionales bacterium]|nr:tetratricopeptide repeat protein [Vampirovibrionales bacterium]